MEDIHSYQIEVGGQIEGGDLNADTPLQVMVEWIGPDSTLLGVRADQSALIGLLRHLHARGIRLISVKTFFKS
jgi:hypothetical protein